MTQAEFLAYCKLYPSQVNVWYTSTTPHTIQGISIPILDLNNNDNTAFLTQVEKVILPLPDGSTVTLDITYITITTVTTAGGGTISFFFLLTTPSHTTGITSNSITPGGISFFPAISGILFSASPYNAIGGVVQASRSSKYLMKSDRLTIGIEGNTGYTGPTNIIQLLSYSASKADVQDSLYSDTGWINGRYNGTETNIYDTSIIPAINGRVFEASIFPLSTPTNQIRFQQSGSQVVYKDYFYTGTGGVPGFSKDLTTFTTDCPYSAKATSIEVTTSENLSENSFEIGDLISFDLISFAEAIDNIEICRVREVTNTGISTFTLTIIRGVYGTPQPITSVSAVYKIQQVQIHELSSNKLQGVPKGRVLVKETGEILRLDSLGYVVEAI